MTGSSGIRVASMTMAAALAIAGAPDDRVMAAGLRQTAAAATNDAFAGVWTADLSKSKQDPKYQFQSVTLHIVVSRDSVTMTSRLTDAGGKEQRATETLRTDGSEHPGSLSPNVTHVSRWVGPKVLATTAYKDGKLIGLITYELSADGKTMTVRSSGMAEQVLLFERK
jgi:hypothetical protein